MLKLRNCCAGLLLVVLMPACSWYQDRPPEYMLSEEVEPLRVPEGLDAIQYRTPLLVGAPQMRLPSASELNPGPPRAVSTGGRGDANAFMAWSAEGVYLSVLDGPQSVNRRLGAVIQSSGMRALDDAANGDHRFEYMHLRPEERSFWQKMAFWNRSSGPDYSGFYRTQVVADGDNTRVFLFLDSGSPAPTGAAEHVLGIFMERLG